MSRDALRSLVPGWLIAVVLAAAVWATALAGISTRNGPATNGDTWDYLWHALGTPEQYDRRINPYGVTHFPPGYPAAIAATNVLTGRPTTTENLLASARWLNVLLAGANVALAAAVAWRLALANRAAAAGLAAVLVATLAEPTKYHTVAISEPLFMTFTLAALALLIGGRGVGLAAAAGAFVGASYGVRYAGVALAGAGVLHLLWPTRQSRWRERVADAVAFALPIAGVVVLVAWRNDNLGGAVGGRTIGFHPPTVDDWQELPKTLSRWLFPSDLTWWALAIGLLLAAVVVAWVGPRVAGRIVAAGPGIRPRAAVLFVAAYLGLLLVTRTFFDEVLQVGMRMFLPVQLTLVALAAAWCASGQADLRVRRAMVVVLLVVPLLNLSDTLHWMIEPTG